MAAAGGAAAHHITFNQDCSSFAVADGHIRVYSCETGEALLNGPVFESGGAALAEPLFSSGYVAFVGDGTDPAFPRHKVVVWSETTRSFIIELEFKSDVLAVRLKKNRMVIITARQIQLYSFGSKPQKLEEYTTEDNPSGLCGLAAQCKDTVMAYPGAQDGSLNITAPDGEGKDLTVVAHTSKLSCIACSADGLLVATASCKGTCIRVFSTKSGELLKEVRRGIDRSLIRSMSFSDDGKRLVVASDKGSSCTVHLFALTSDDEVANTQSSLFSLRSVLPEVFSSEWSYAQLHLEGHSHCIAAFSKDGSNKQFVVVAPDGKLFHCAIDPKAKGHCKVLSTQVFGEEAEAAAAGP